MASAQEQHNFPLQIFGNLKFIYKDYNSVVVVSEQCIIASNVQGAERLKQNIDHNKAFAG